MVDCKYVTGFNCYPNCLKQIFVCLDVFFVCFDSVLTVNIEGVAVLHDKFLGSHQSEFGPLLLAEFVSYL